MEYFVGLDVSMEETSLCVVDQDGRRTAQKKHYSATIVVDDRQFRYQINPDGVFGTHPAICIDVLVAGVALTMR
jgi:hypothetical protein